MRIDWKTEEFSEAIPRLKEPLNTVLSEMQSHQDDNYIVLNYGSKGVAMVVKEANASDMDVIYFATKHYQTSFESNIAASRIEREA